MRRLAQACPGTDAEFVVDSSENMREQLRRGELDLAFLAGPLTDPAITTRPLSRTAMAWVASPAFDLPAGTLGPADLADVPIISDARGGFLHGLAIAPPSLTARDLADGSLRLVDTAPELPCLDYFAALAAGAPSPAVRAVLDAALDAIAAEPHPDIHIGEPIPLRE